MQIRLSGGTLSGAPDPVSLIMKPEDLCPASGHMLDENNNSEVAG